MTVPRSGSACATACRQTAADVITAMSEDKDLEPSDASFNLREWSLEEK